MSNSYFPRSPHFGFAERDSYYPRPAHGHHQDHQDSLDYRSHHYPPSYSRFYTQSRRLSGDSIARPASGSWLDRGKKSGPSENDVARLKAEDLEAPEDLGLTESEAVKLAVDALNSYHRSHVQALTGSKSQLHWEYPKKLLPFQVFHELDQELFRGVLKGHIHLRWSELPPEYHGMTSRPGKRVSRATIELNSRFKHVNDDMKWCRGALLAALIHQMSHAYFLVCCGHRNAGVSSTQHDLGHGLSFSTLLDKIQKTFVPNGYPRFPSLLTCTSLNRSIRQSLRLSRRSPYQVSRASSNSDPTPGSSKCCFVIKETIPGSACQEYFQNLPAVTRKVDLHKEGEGKSGITNPYPIERFLFTLDPNSRISRPIPRSEFSLPRSEFVEFHFDGQAYPVSRVKITAHPSLRIKLQQIRGFKNVPIPASSFDEFLSLISFLDEGKYPPEISEQYPHLMLDNMSKGPPRIAEFKRDSKPYLIIDIRAYSIAKKIGFDELRKKALERLYAQAATHNDPMEALEEIYDRLEPVARDKDLRKWVVQWLLTTRCELESRTNGSTNIEFLCVDPQWKERFGKLRQKGGDFLQDCDAGQSELLRLRGLTSCLTAFLAGGSTAASGTRSSGGNTTTPSFAPASMRSPTFRDDLPTRNFANEGAGWIPTRAPTPYWSGGQNGWGNGSAWR